MEIGSARILVRAAFLAVAATANLSAQDSLRAPPASTPRSTSSQASGPVFFRVRPEDGDHIDARDAPELARRITLTMIGVPLETAIEAIAARAALDVSYGSEYAPLRALVSMKADDVTVAAALSWVLANLPLDVLVDDNGGLTLVPRAAADADSSGVIVGVLVDQDGGEPIPYATTSLLGTDRTRFADAGGHFRLARLPPRRYVLRARQIGYAPIDTTIEVAAGPAVTTVTVHLHRIPVLMKLVRVIGHRPKGCVATGAPNPAADPQLAALFTQVRENVDRYRLLLDEYPFEYIREERRELQNGIRNRMLTLDTIAYDSRTRHPYQAGEVVFEAQDKRRGRRRYMYLPTFADLADSAFLATHCFSMGVYQHSRIGDVFRVDFQPADRLRTPDVAGSVYLDARRLVVRRADFHLTRPNEAHPPVIELNVSATFRDFVPFVPMLDSVTGRQTLPVYGHDLAGIEREIPGSVQYIVENDHVVRATFMRRFPGEQLEALRSMEVDSSIRLRGRVIGTDGTPISGARIRGFESLNIVQSDDSGRFTYVGAPPAHQILEVWHSTYLPRRILVSMRSADARMQITLAHAAARSPAGTRDGETVALIPRAHFVFGSNARCKPPPARDSVEQRLYALLSGHRPMMASDSAWARFLQHTLLALDRSFALPTDLPVPVFSAPSTRMVSASADDRGARHPTVVPVFSSVVTFDLDTAGSIGNVRMGTSSLSGPADTSVMAAVERAQANGVLPALPPSWAVSGTAQLRLVVSNLVPSPGVPARRVGVAVVPEWVVDRGMTLDSAHQRRLRLQTHCTKLTRDIDGHFPCLDTPAGDTVPFVGDSASFTAVVDGHGRVVMQSIRFERDYAPWFTKHIIETLPRFTFTPAQIGSCAVNELTALTFYLPAGQW